MNPKSAAYYIKHNKGRAAVMIFMLIFTCMMYLAGNYIESISWFWKKGYEYSEKIVLVSGTSNDENFTEYNALVEKLKNDKRLTVLDRTANGVSGLGWTCTLGWEMGTVSYVFNSVEDMKTAFRRLGIECDFSNIKDHSMVMSKTFAKNLGYELGKEIPLETISSFNSGSVTLDALIDDDSFVNFFVLNDSENILRVYVMSDEMEGEELYEYVRSLAAGKPVKVDSSLEDGVKKELSPILFIFMLGNVMLSLIMAVTANSVITGQYIKRTYEFAIYRAIGLSKKEIRRKCAFEILLMDLIAILVGAALIFTVTFLLNELVLQPAGKYVPYYSSFALLSFLISNLMVIIPMIISKGRKMSKADVTEF